MITFRPLVFAFSLFVYLGSVGASQETKFPGRYSLENWTAEGGQVTEGLLQSYDPAKFQAVILMPKIVKMELLAPESKERIKERATEPICRPCPECPKLPAPTPAPVEQPKPKNFVLEYEQKPYTLKDWKYFTEEQKNGSVGDVIFSCLKIKIHTNEFIQKTKSLKDLNALIREISELIDANVKILQLTHPDEYESFNLMITTMTLMQTENLLDKEKLAEVMEVLSQEFSSKQPSQGK